MRSAREHGTYELNNDQSGHEHCDPDTSVDGIIPKLNGHAGCDQFVWESQHPADSVLPADSRAPDIVSFTTLRLICGP